MRQIVSIVTIRLYKLDTSFRMRLVSIRSIEPVLRSRHAPPKERFSYKDVIKTM